MRNSQATSLEAELHAINHAIAFLAYDTDCNLPPFVRILTDSYEALETLRSHTTTNPLAHEIIHQVEILQRNQTQVRIDRVPGHEPSSLGNQAAHEVAQESAYFQPPLSPDEQSSRSPTPLPVMRLLRYKKDRRDRLKSKTPPGYLSDLPPLPRSSEIFINKFLNNAAYIPEMHCKWYTPHLPPRCPYCHTSTTANLTHLVSSCPTFAKHRSFTAPQLHPDPQQLDKQLLHQIALYSLKSGLPRVV